jgi:hypothetical protein
MSEADEPDAVVDADDVQELLLEDPETIDDAPRTSIIGYPTRPLYREISNILYMWMVTKYVYVCKNYIEVALQHTRDIYLIYPSWK